MNVSEVNNTLTELQDATAVTAVKNQFEKAPKAKKRELKTVNFNALEFEHVDKIVAARIEAKITTDWNHFLRQCVDFAINHKAANVSASFATPDDVQPRLLKNAFYEGKIKHIKTCS